MNKRNWKFKNDVDENTILSLADSLNISKILAKLLLMRGITNFYEAKKYFRPSLDSLYDPFLMKGMEDASSRIIEAVTNNEKICVYGDYDVDGTCSAAVLYLFLKELNAEVEIYIPNRITEGYGVSNSSIDNLHEKGVNLIVTVDCGITAITEVDHANSLNIDVIVCDHHQPKDSIPNAVAVLDALRSDCEYPFKYLSGAGVAFKLTRAVAARIGMKDSALKYLDLVAIAAAADIVPLTDENRILVKQGMELINQSPRPGIKALVKIARMDLGNLSAGQIVFTIAPRINAVGRMGDAIRAVELFVSNDPKESSRLAQVLENENIERRKIDESTFSHALKLVDETVNLDNDLAIVLHGENWHPGVIGIVASRLVEKYHRPAIMLSTVDGVAKGSARSISSINIYEALEACNDILLQFGGHKAAAGLAVEIEKIPELRDRINMELKEKISHDEILPEIKVDSNISFSDITPKFIRILDQFAPFGPGNMRPVFLAENISFSNTPRIVGTNHLIACLKQNGCEKIFDSIGFNLGSYLNQIDKDKNLMDIVFTIEKIVKDGRTYPQLRIKDIKIK